MVPHSSVNWSHPVPFESEPLLVAAGARFIATVPVYQKFFTGAILKFEPIFAGYFLHSIFDSMDTKYPYCDISSKARYADNVIESQYIQLS